MGNISIMNLSNSKPINPETLFGKDTQRLFDACNRVMNNWLYPYKGCKEWENQRDKQFRIIYGIAKRYGLYLEWHGKGNPCCGDRWEIYRNHERIARICC